MPETNLAFATIRELGEKLRAKEVSSVQLAEFFLSRLETFGPVYNAVVRVTRDVALAQAKQADEELKAGKDRGPLHGIPFGVKDLLATKGIPTSWGAAPLKDQMLDEDATVVVRLREAGAVLCAKLAMVELAGGFGYKQADASFTGPGLCAWDKTCWSGGSSSGPGSAVGAGLVPFAIGSETWGSIMTPAGYNGIAGLRPTYGRVSRHGAMALSWTMDKLGPMCRTADDCGLVLDAIAGPDPLDPSSIASEWRYDLRSASSLPPLAPQRGEGPGVRGDERERPQSSAKTKAPLTLTLSPEDGGEGTKPNAEQGRFKFATLDVDFARLAPEVRANYEASLEILKQIGSFEAIKLPEFPYGTVAGTIISCEMGAAFEGFMTSGDVWELTAPEDRFGGFSNLVIPAKDYINALRIRGKIQRAMDELLSRFDAVVTPTLNTESGPITQKFAEWSQGFTSTELSGASNAIGLPGITVPNGFGARGLPTGLEFTGRAYNENAILAAARVYQQRTDWHTKTPKVE
ncbi:MAG: amidase [Candidatus Saccharimonas sp.]|nr:amidase [Planctomycetaceae bacterium]